MRKSKQCPKCDSLKIGLIERGAAAPEVGLTAAIDEARQRNRAHAMLALFGGTGADQDSEPESEGQADSLCAYLCTECGYTETYLTDPTSLPYEQVAGFRWVNPVQPEQGPYR